MDKEGKLKFKLFKQTTDIFIALYIDKICNSNKKLATNGGWEVELVVIRIVND